MHDVVPAGLQTLCEEIFTSDSAEYVRVRVGLNGRQAKQRPGVSLISTEEVKTTADLERLILNALRLSQYGQRPETQVFRIEALNSKKRSVSGLSLTGRGVSASPALPAAPPPDATPEQHMQAAFAALVQQVAGLVSSVNQTNETLRITVETLGSANADLRVANNETMLSYSRLRAENARLRVKSETGIDIDADGEGQGLLGDVLKQVIDLKMGGATFTKSALLKAVKDNPARAVEIISDPEIMKAVAEASKKEAAAAAKAAETST